MRVFNAESHAPCRYLSIIRISVDEVSFEMFHLKIRILTATGISDQTEDGEKTEVKKSFAQNTPHADLFDTLATRPRHFFASETRWTRPRSGLRRDLQRIDVRCLLKHQIGSNLDLR